MHTHVPFVLVVEPDLRQASVLKRVIRDRVHAELMVVDSRDAAIAATSSRVPDVILLTALLSPRDEAELIAHLRGLSGAEHVQTHTIPQLASSSHDSDGGQEHGGLFGKLRRRKAAEQPIPGCDPAAFADEVGTFVERAAEMKAHAALMPPPVIEARREEARGQEHERGGGLHSAEASSEQPDVDSGSAWASPFEWRRPDPSAQKKTAQNDPPPPRRPLVRNAPLAVVAEEEEARRADSERRAREEAQERERLEAEAAAKRERERLEAEAAAQRERERLEAEGRAKEEAERRGKEEAERRAKAEAERRAKEEAERRAKEEAERRAKAEAERRAKEEAERRAKAEAERRAKDEADRRAKAEAERRAKEEAVKRERQRLEAERRAKEEAAKRERERLEAEAAAQRERERLEAEAAQRLRQEAEERARLEAEEDAEIEIDLDRDPFSDFRVDGEHESALLKLMPVTAWARVGDGRRQPPEPARADEVRDLIAGLSIPPQVAAVAYAHGCRIRRVRVPAPRPAARSRMSRPVILSKRALEAARNDQQSDA